jgi:hypothetical protein
METPMRLTTKNRVAVLNAVIENFDLTIVGSKEKTLFFADPSGNGELVEVPVDVEKMTARQLLDAALDFHK